MDLNPARPLDDMPVCNDALPREIVLSLASNVSIATAEGLIRFTSSGRKSCAPTMFAKNTIHPKKDRIIFRFRAVILAIDKRTLNYMPFTPVLQRKFCAKRDPAPSRK
jgi:hypothetical protein